MKPTSDEFYIGWQKVAPAGFARAATRFIVAMVILFPLMAVLTVVFQQGFSRSSFEFGKLTEVRGIFYRQAAPFLLINHGNDASGQPVIQQLLLVAEGKHGFDHLETAPGVQNGDSLTMSGYLIYYDGKTALEVKAVAHAGHPASGMAVPKPVVLGQTTLRGELTDPKCFFGVMKPGYGKPHLDCAARCIAGGIPPMLTVCGNGGESEYYLLAGPKGEPLNDCLKNYAADGLQVTGRLEQQGDWYILYFDPKNLKRLYKDILQPASACAGG